MPQKFDRYALTERPVFENFAYAQRFQILG